MESIFSFLLYICIYIHIYIHIYIYMYTVYIYMDSLPLVILSLRLRPSLTPLLDNINIARWKGCRDKVSRNVKNAELQMKSCIVRVRSERANTDHVKLSSRAFIRTFIGLLSLLAVLSRTMALHLTPLSTPSHRHTHTHTSLSLLSSTRLVSSQLSREQSHNTTDGHCAVLDQESDACPEGRLHGRLVPDLWVTHTHTICSVTKVKLVLRLTTFALFSQCSWSFGGVLSGTEVWTRVEIEKVSKQCSSSWDENVRRRKKRHGPPSNTSSSLSPCTLPTC